MAALRGAGGKSQMSLTPAAPDALHMAALLVSPALSGTSRSRALLWLDWKLKILQEAETGQKPLRKKHSYLCPADPPAFPALRQEERGTGEGKKGRGSGEGQGRKRQVCWAVLSAVTLLYLPH